MNVIGNNISNVNTTGFKKDRVTFQEALVANVRGAGRPSDISGGTNPIQLGLGMSISAVDTVFDQGGLETTGQVTDLAIQGSGFFILSDGNKEYYTRNGAFGFDADSYLVDPGSGLRVQGRMADDRGNISATSTISDIQLPFGQQDPASATTEIRLSNNLDASATDSDVLDWEPGTTGIDIVEGTATNGAGGYHSVVITNDDPAYNPLGQAQRSTYTGTHAGATINMTPTTTLGDMGITIFDDFGLSVDGASISTMAGWTADTTIEKVVSDINELYSGVECSLTGGPPDYQVHLERSYAGDNGSFFIESGTAVAGDIVNILFGVADGSNFASTGGLDHTFKAIDTFMPYDSAAEAPVELDIVVDENTGIADTIEGLGDDGVTVNSTSANGISEGTLNVETAATQHSTSITTYDSQGGKHTLIFTFTKTTTDNLWNWDVSFPDEENIIEGGSGEVHFGSDGSLLSWTFNGGATQLVFDPGTGASNCRIYVNAGDPGSVSGLTGFASSFTASADYQDGYSMGILEKISVDTTGNITGVFSNGMTRTLAQIILAEFNNDGGLNRSGNSLYEMSANSGPAVHGVAGETVAGSITSGALESSNVDIAEEFTNMITTQRGYQANSRIITTSDTMLEELVNLKR